MIHWMVAALAFFSAGWMVFDGLRAFLVGDYVTPHEGKYAGQLGPWSNLVKFFGIDPRSTLMKSIFILYGILWLSADTCFILSFPWAWKAMMAFAVGSLWYLVVGTFLGTLQIILLLFLI